MPDSPKIEPQLKDRGGELHWYFSPHYRISTYPMPDELDHEYVHDEDVLIWDTHEWFVEQKNPSGGNWIDAEGIGRPFDTYTEAYNALREVINAR